MDFYGAPSMDGLVSVPSDLNALFPSSFPPLESELTPLESEATRTRGLFGLGFSKHDRCDVVDENEWSDLKMAKGAPMLASRGTKGGPCFLRSTSHSLFPEGETMVSFSSANPATVLRSDDWALPSIHPSASSSSSAPFYLRKAALVPIPSRLLTPIRKGIDPSLFPSSSAGSDNGSAGTSESQLLAVAGGSFHLGFCGSSDPEPGRCRRTDGKKWRCSRDAVIDQRYCERHLNRGRHRSRKHVEGQNCDAGKATASTSTNSQSASTVSRVNLSNRKCLQSSMTESSVQLDRLLIEKEDASAQARNFTGNLLPILKQQNHLEGALSRAGFGLIHSDSLADQSQGRSCSENIGLSALDAEMNDQPSHPLQHFFDDLPKNLSDCSTVSWANVDELQACSTQLSMSIPMASSDFSYSPSSPIQGTLSNGSKRYLNWIPISSESIIGGPLGEVVSNKSSTPKDLIGRNISSSSLHLLTDGWNSSKKMESSPAAVLQKASYGWLSSSAGSSPRAENADKAQESDEMKHEEDDAAGGADDGRW